MENRLLIASRIAKVIFMVAVLCVAVIVGMAMSCTSATHEDWQKYQDRECASHITKFNYEGHSYLLYRDGDRGTGIAHDANCECFFIPNSDYD